MTYIEKVMQAVKFDKELLDLTEQSLAYFKDAVKDGVGSALSDEYCPGFFSREPLRRTMIKPA